MVICFINPDKRMGTRFIVRCTLAGRFFWGIIL